MTHPAHPVTSPNAIEEFHAALALVRPRAASLSDDDLALLRERLFAAVDQMRAEEISPKQAVVIVKGLAAVTGLQWISMELIAQLASWSAERFGQRDDAAASELDGPVPLSQLPNGRSSTG
jgi:hypothetical protein